MLYRLTYASTVSRGAATVLDATVEDILIESVINNTRDRITGFLLCDGVSFVQVLEGSEAAVEGCFARIEADSRHHKIVVRERNEVDARLFPGWSMCGLTLSNTDDALLTAPDIEFDLRNAKAGALVQLLSSLAWRHGHELDAVHARLLMSARL